jgi:hypothetical protein
LASALPRRKGKTLNFAPKKGWSAVPTADCTDWCRVYERIRTAFSGGGSRANGPQPPPAAAPF